MRGARARRWKPSTRTAVVVLMLGLPCAGVAQAAAQDADRARGGAAAVTGVVFDAVTGRPVPGATVSLIDAERDASTDSSGLFRFDGVVATDLTLRVSATGFTTSVERLALTEGEESFLQLPVTPLAAAIEELLVLGSRDGPAPGYHETLVSGAEEGRAAATAADLLSERVPGVDLRRSLGSAAGGANVRLRGANSLSSSDHPAIYVDGIRVVAEGEGFGSRASAGMHYLEQLPASSVRSIRILRGPAASARYGSTANGVILIETWSEPAR